MEDVVGYYTQLPSNISTYSLKSLFSVCTEGDSEASILRHKYVLGGKKKKDPDNQTILRLWGKIFNIVCIFNIIRSWSFYENDYNKCYKVENH